jgi:hypothetical protein
MGSLSCFAGGLALPHHLIVQQCASDLSKELPFLQYAVLGDDIVIWDSDVARLYEERVTINLQMQISRQKSIIGSGICEFAKTLCLRGELVTPLPWMLLNIVRKYPGFLIVLLRDLRDRYGLSTAKLKNLVALVPPRKRQNAVRLLSCINIARISGTPVESSLEYLKEMSEGRTPIGDPDPTVK